MLSNEKLNQSIIETKITPLKEENDDNKKYLLSNDNDKNNAEFYSIDTKNENKKEEEKDIKQDSTAINYNYTFKKAICSCHAKESSPSFADMKIDKNKLLDNFKNINFSSSDKKLENKIRELEAKLDNKLESLNYASMLTSTNNFNNNEDIKNKDEDKSKGDNILEKYSILNNQGLSDITKAYLGSYISGDRPELSDFSKAYINGISSNNSIRPELSNLTMEYLKNNTSDFKKEEIEN